MGKIPNPLHARVTIVLVCRVPTVLSEDAGLRVLKPGQSQADQDESVSSRHPDPLGGALCLLSTPTHIVHMLEEPEDVGRRLCRDPSIMGSHKIKTESCWMTSAEVPQSSCPSGCILQVFWIK